MSSTATETYLKKKDICTRLNICTRTLDRMVAEGVFPPPDVTHRGRGGLRRWKARTFEKWEQAQQKKG